MTDLHNNFECPEKSADNTERNDKIEDMNEEMPEKEKSPEEMPDDNIDNIEDDEVPDADISSKEELPEKENADKPEKHADHLPRTGGRWENEIGNSAWYPDPEKVPGDRHGTNPDHKQWKEIFDEYGVDHIDFNDGEPDFSEVSKGEVKIENFSANRPDNFAQADERLAEQRGCDPEDVEDWREENRYTWHECKDCETMQKVPSEIHGNIPHSGGISQKRDI